MDQSKISLYQGIVSQLEDDGFYGAASAVAQATMLPREKQPTDGLSRLVEAGQRFVDSGGTLGDSETVSDLVGGGAGVASADAGLDFSQTPTQEVIPKYETKFVTTHKAPCRAACFSSDGALVATASTDASIKVLGVSKMVNYNRTTPQTDRNPEEISASKPVLRTLYSHTQPINDLDWHPYSPILVSCAKDSTIKFFDIAKAATTKAAFQSIQDTHCIYSLSYHPSGDFILAGTDHNAVHLYDVKTFQCYTPAADHHSSGINQIRCAADGKQYATAGKDGAVKIWDIVSNKCTATLGDAHDKTEVTCVGFSKNGKYLLSSGKNSTVVLWDLATHLPLMNYRGHRHQRFRTQACFSHNEQHVLTGDDTAGGDLVVWSTRKGEIVQRQNAGHQAPIRWITHSPVSPHMVTCSEDYRGRFWTAT